VIVFEGREAVGDAIACSMDGGQALHIFKPLGENFKDPLIELAAYRRGEDIGYIYDQDKSRLIAALKACGLRNIDEVLAIGEHHVIRNAGSRLQRVPVWGEFLCKARNLADFPNEIEESKPVEPAKEQQQLSLF